MTTRIHIQRIQLEGFSFGPHERTVFHESLVENLAQSHKMGRLEGEWDTDAGRASRRPISPGSIAAVVADAVRQRASE